MQRADEALTGSGGVPTDVEIDPDMYNVYSQWQQGMHLYNTFFNLLNLPPLLCILF